MYDYNNLTHFKFWCQKVLPLVYDDSLSYYEILCKVVDYVNKLIDDDKAIIENVNELKSELRVVQKWIADFDTEFIKKVVEDYIATMIFIEISDSGYIIYYIPENWSDITFNTTGLDINVDNVDNVSEYGRLVLSY